MNDAGKQEEIGNEKETSKKVEVMLSDSESKYRPPTLN